MLHITNITPAFALVVVAVVAIILGQFPFLTSSAVLWILKNLSFGPPSWYISLYLSSL